MARRSYYSSVTRARKSASYTVAVVLSVILALLIGFIIWAVVVFGNGGEGAFLNQASEISDLKIQLNEKDAVIAQLTAELEDYRSKALQQTPTPVPTAAPTPTAKPSPTPRPVARQTAAPTQIPPPPTPAESRNDTSPEAGHQPVQTAVPAVGSGI